MQSPLVETDAITGAPEEAAPARPPARPFALIIVTLAFAVFAACWGLRGAWSTGAVFPDASRHALNGALIHDMIRDGGYADPAGYTRRYYNRLPGISIPYHPPVFPAFEAAVYAVLGVNYPAARIAIAISVAVSFALFVALVFATHGSAAIALLAGIGFFGIGASQWAAQEVMLEFPSLVFVLLAMFALRTMAERGFPLRDGIVFGLLASAAIWTKQHSVFLTGVPFALLLIRREWRWLRSGGLWAAAVLPATAFGAVMLLSRAGGTGNNAGWRNWPLYRVIDHHIDFYSRAVAAEIGLAATIFLAVAAAWYIIVRIRSRAAFRESDLYAAWAASAMGLMLILRPWEARYLFYAFAPLAVIGFTVAAAAGRRIAGAGNRAWAPACAIAAAAFTISESRPPDRLDGMAEAARLVAASVPRRVLAAGSHNGSFIFEMRAADPGGTSMVLRADKLPDEVQLPGAFERFLHEFGIGAVVIEDTVQPEVYDWLRHTRPSSLVLERTIPLRARHAADGDLLVFRFTNPSPTPADSIHLPSALVKGGIHVLLTQ